MQLTSLSLAAPAAFCGRGSRAASGRARTGRRRAGSRGGSGRRRRTRSGRRRGAAWDRSPGGGLREKAVAGAMRLVYSGYRVLQPRSTSGRGSLALPLAPMQQPVTLSLPTPTAQADVRAADRPTWTCGGSQCGNCAAWPWPWRSSPAPSGRGQGQAGPEGRPAIARRQEDLRPGEADQRRPGAGAADLCLLRLRPGAGLLPEAAGRLQRQGPARPSPSSARSPRPSRATPSRRTSSSCGCPTPRATCGRPSTAKAMPTNILIDKGGKVVKVVPGCTKDGKNAQTLSAEIAKLLQHPGSAAKKSSVASGERQVNARATSPLKIFRIAAALPILPLTLLAAHRSPLTTRSAVRLARTSPLAYNPPALPPRRGRARNTPRQAEHEFGTRLPPIEPSPVRRLLAGLVGAVCRCPRLVLALVPARLRPVRLRRRHSPCNTTPPQRPDQPPQGLPAALAAIPRRVRRRRRHGRRRQGRRPRRA